jgi:hypothetical protein
MRATLATVHGVVFDIFCLGARLLAGRLAELAVAAPVRLRPVGLRETAFTRFALSSWHWLA